MKKIYLAILSVLILLNCPKTEPQKKLEDKIIFEVEGKVYKQSDFSSYLEFMQYESIEQKPLILSRIFDNFFHLALVCEFSRFKGFELSSEKMAELGNEKEEKKRRIKELNLIYENFLTEIIKSKLSVTREEIEEYYKTHEEEFRRVESVRVYQILVSSESEALEILRILKKSPPEAFEKIAREKSISPEGVRGGDMGYFQRGELPLEIENVVFSLRVGELSPVVKSSFGYHLFKVVDKKGPRVLSLNEVEKSIAEELAYKKKDLMEKEILEEAKNTLKWKIHFENLSFTYMKGEENE